MKTVQHKFRTLIVLLLIGLVFTSCGNDKKGEKENSTKENKTAQADTYHYTYSFKMKQPGSNELTPSGSSEMYFSEKAVRSETNLEIMGQKTEMVMLVKADKPEQIIMLHNEDKSYSIFNPDDLKMGGEMADKMKDMRSDSLTVLGKEKMNGYECTHLQIVKTVDVPESVRKMVGEASSVEEYWVSQELPGSSVFESWAESRPKMMRGMNSEIYQYGIPVKMVSKEGDAVNMVMELKEAKGQNQNNSLFEIPSGYTKKE